MQKIFSRGVCFSTVPLVGKCCLVFPRRLHKARLHRTSSNKKICQAIRPGIGCLGGCADHLDYNISALSFSMGGSSRLPLIHNPPGRSLTHLYVVRQQIMNMSLLANMDTMGSVLS